MHCLPLQTVTYQGWRNSLHCSFDSLRLLKWALISNVAVLKLVNWSLKIFLEKVVNKFQSIPYNTKSVELIFPSVKQNPKNAHIDMAFLLIESMFNQLISFSVHITKTDGANMPLLWYLTSQYYNKFPSKNTKKTLLAMYYKTRSESHIHYQFSQVSTRTNNKQYEVPRNLWFSNSSFLNQFAACAGRSPSSGNWWAAQYPSQPGGSGSPDYQRFSHTSQACHLRCVEYAQCTAHGLCD